MGTDKEFILPEKWCINRKNKPEVVKWFSEKKTDLKFNYELRGWYTHWPISSPGSITGSCIRPGYAEITFEQFRKAVLNEPKPENKPQELTAFPKEGCCRTDKKELRDYLKKLMPDCYVSDWDSLHWQIVAWDIDTKTYYWCVNRSGKPEYTYEQLEKFLKPKHTPVIHQGVHCKTQEEWDFVCSKMDKHLLKNCYSEYKSDSVIRLDLINGYGDVTWCNANGYQIISFEEWCKQEGYEIEKPIEFKAGQWYKYRDWYIKFSHYDSEGIWRSSEHIDNIGGYYVKMGNFGTKSNDKYRTPVSLDEIQQYLPDGHPDKMQPWESRAIKTWIFLQNENVFKKVLQPIAKDLIQSSPDKYRLATESEMILYKLLYTNEDEVKIDLIIEVISTKKDLLNIEDDNTFVPLKKIKSISLLNND